MQSMGWYDTSAVRIKPRMEEREMQKRTRTMLAGALALSLALPLVATGNDSAAAGKAPKLTPKNSAVIIYGKTKTFTIKNVKKSNVKSLKVKVYNKSVAKFGKKILTNKKVGFTVKAVGGGYSDMDVILKLKTPQAGKTVYKFSDYTIQAGSKAKPIVSLSDEVTSNTLLAMVLKAGTEADYDKLDNALTLEVFNTNEIGGRNLYGKWFEDGKEKEEWSRDLAGGRTYRPDSPASAVSGPSIAVSGPAAVGPVASGSAVKPTNEQLGIVEKTYYVEVENMLSHKKAKTNTKIVRILPEYFINFSHEMLQNFKRKYPGVTSIPTENPELAQFVSDFKLLINTYGRSLGFTKELLVEYSSNIDKVRDNPGLFKELLESDKAEFTHNFEDVAKYLGLVEEDVLTFVDYFFAYLGKAFQDPSLDIAGLMD